MYSKNQKTHPSAKKHIKTHKKHIKNTFRDLFSLYTLYIMVVYDCIPCKYSTKRKTEFKRHLLTKKHTSHLLVTNQSPENHHLVTPKPPFSQPKVNLFEQNELQCKYCLKQFKYKQGMYRHIKYTCKQNKDEDFKELARLMNEKEKQLKVQGSQLEKMQKQIDKLTNKLQIQNINNGTINNSNNVVNIQLLNHTETDYSHLTHKDYVMCIHDCNKCVKTMIEKVHFNKDKPENHNIYLSNLKGKYVMIYKDNAWQIINKKEQLDDMYDYNEMILEYWYDEYKTKYPDIVKSFQRYLKNKDGNDLLNKVKDEILMMLYNKRKMAMLE